MALEPGGKPTLSWHTLKTAFPDGNVSIVQLGAADQIRLIKGQTVPVQGSMSKTINDWTAAVTVDTSARGSTVRFQTLLIPKPSIGTAVRITDKTVTPYGIKFTVWVGTARERVVINTSSVTVTQLN